MDESTVSQTDYLKAKHRRTVLYTDKFSRKATLEVSSTLFLGNRYDLVSGLHITVA